MVCENFLLKHSQSLTPILLGVLQLDGCCLLQVKKKQVPEVQEWNLRRRACNHHSELSEMSILVGTLLLNILSSML